MADHICPVWIGRLMALPLRRLFHDPEQILSGYVEPGMTVLDVGCAMGFFSLPLARLVGPRGRVLCVDCQEKMLKSLAKRADRARLLNALVLRACTRASLQLEDQEGRVDFALAFAMVHEAPEPAQLLAQLARTLRPGGQLLLAEPNGHVTAQAFERTLDLARAPGLILRQRPRIRGMHAALLQRPAA